MLRLMDRRGVMQLRTWTAVALSLAMMLAACGSSSLDEGNPSEINSADAPTITSFTADRDKVSIGKTVTLTAVFSGGTGIIDNGIGAVTSNTPKVTSPINVPTTYTL